MNIGQLIAGTGLILLAFIIVLIIGMMRIFKKAGRPQLSAVFPVLNLIEYSNIAGKPGWWGIAICALPMIPFGENMIANILAGGISLTMLIILTHELSKNFGKGADFTAGLVLLPGVFHCVLGFGNAEYRGSEGSTKRAIYEEKKAKKIVTQIKTARLNDSWAIKHFHSDRRIDVAPHASLRQIASR